MRISIIARMEKKDMGRNTQQDIKNDTQKSTKQSQRKNPKQRTFINYLPDGKMMAFVIKN